MSRRADPERLYVAHRIALVNRLVASGQLDANAERWVAAWEAEARERGLDGRSVEWWAPAWEWIAVQRRSKARTPT